MRALLRWITARPLVTGIAVVAVCLLGVDAAFQVPVDLFPHLDVPVVNVVTHLQGAAPEDVELLVTRPIEDAVRGLPGVRRVQSTSAEGVSQVTVELAWGTGVDAARQLVQSALARLQGTLPTAAVPRLETLGTTLEEVSAYVLYGPGDPVALGTAARHDLASRLQGVEGVASIQVLGGERRAFWVDLPPAELARLHLTVDRVSALIDRQNTGNVAGVLARSGREALVRGDARLRDLDDLRSVPLVAAGESSVPLGAVAAVHAGFAPKHDAIRGDGHPAVALVVRKQPGASTGRVVAAVDRALGDLTGLLPPGTSVHKVYDQSEILRSAQEEIVLDLALGALLAVVVLWLFLGALRPTLIVAATIPITLLATIAVLRIAGLGFDIVTLTALALVIGMIVDDAIVVGESIERHAGEGEAGASAEERREAAVTGAAEIAGPDTTGTLTTVAAFLPLAIVGGIAGIFLRPFGLTVSAALLVSLVLSLTLVPALYGLARRPRRPRQGGDGEEGSSGAAAPGARLLALLDRLLGRSLRACLRHPVAVIAAALLVVAVAIGAGFLVRVSVLPPIDEGAILIEYVLPPGTSLAESDRVGARLDRLALAEPEVTAVYRRTGSPESGVQIEGVNRGELLIKLAPRGDRERPVGEIMAALRRSYSTIDGAVFLYHQPTQEKIDESFSGLPALFGVTVYGEDLDALTALAGRVEQVMAADPVVAGVVNNTKVRAGEVEVRLDRRALARAGAEPAAVLSALEASQRGVEATRIVRRRDTVGVWLRLRGEGGGGDARAGAGPARAGAWTPETLGRLPVPLASGALVPLERLATVRLRPTPAAITRLDGQREITLVAEVDGSIPALVGRLRARFRTLERPAGTSISFTGQYPVLLRTGEELLFAVAGAALLIYLILVLQFGSWAEPLVILASVPLALAGAVIALALTGRGLDVSVAMGAMTLVGVAVNNSIVLLDFARKAQKAKRVRQDGQEGGDDRSDDEGSATAATLLEAASVRLRPILLTTATTVAALVPAAVGTTAGSSLFQTFAVTVIGGLVGALAATLLLTPTLALLISRPRLRRPRPPATPSAGAAATAP